MFDKLLWEEIFVWCDIKANEVSNFLWMRKKLFGNIFGFLNMKKIIIKTNQNQRDKKDKNWTHNFIHSLTLHIKSVGNPNETKNGSTADVSSGQWLYLLNFNTILESGPTHQVKPRNQRRQLYRKMLSVLVVFLVLYWFYVKIIL